MIRPIFLLFILSLGACQEKQQQPEPTVEYPDLTQLVVMECQVETPSHGLLKLVNYLEEQDYAYSQESKSDDFQFTLKDGDFNVVEVIILEHCVRQNLFFRQNTGIGGGNMYPKFGVVEFCFPTAEQAEKQQQELTRVVNQQEKHYGYFLRYDNHLIFVHTGVNRYSFIINEFKPVFEQLLNSDQ
jgi:hypothetical protein